ncbi:MAG: AMP-binding protein [Candidatus Humimicrobiaceae bacterium]
MHVDTDLNEKFKKSGISKGQKIAFLCSNSMEYVKLLTQIIFLEGVVVPVSPVMPAYKIHNMLKNIGCSKIIVGEETDYKDDASIKSISFKYFNEELRKINFKKITSGFDICKYSVNSERNASIFLTSGSTNIPKAVLHSFANHWYSAIGSNANISFKTGDCWVVALPLNHVSGFSAVFKALAGQADVYVKPLGIDLLESLKSDNSHTHISLIPAQLSELIEDPSGVVILKKFKAILIGGSPAPHKLMEEAKSLGLNVFNSYGSTEMSSQITCTVQNDSLGHLKTSGKLLKYRELKISGESEILVKGKTLFRGYVKHISSKSPDIHKNVDKEGWFSTNDLGFMDEDGYLHVYGRKDLMFVSNGENIFPEEIENALKEMNEIDDAIIVPVEGSRNDQKPAAFLKTKNNLRLDYLTLRKKLIKKIECFKIPAVFFDWPNDIEKSSFKPDRESYRKRANDLMSRNLKNNRSGKSNVF